MATTVQGGGGSSQSLNFRIFQCSSQDPSYPVAELVSMSKDQNQLVGWQSQRFCVFPQEIVIQFPCLVHLKQLQFLVHQNKIPSRIELYAYAPDFTSLGAANLVSPNNQNISFARLGHFSLDDNIRTNYQARELKTVYLEQYCQYLKIVIHKNHLNSLNIFNQVGLVSLTCTGSYIGDYEMSAVQQRVGGVQSDMPQVSNPAQLMPRNLRIAGVNEEELDASVQEKIRVLSEAKIKAVDEEDFDKAKYLKDAIDKLKLAGSQLVQLEVQKKLAIDNEDFDSAKILKFEIERLKNLAMNLDTERIITQTVYQQQQYLGQQNHQEMQQNHMSNENRYSKQNQLKHHPYNYGEDDMVSAHNQMMMTVGSGDERDPNFEESKVQHLQSMQNHHNLLDGDQQLHQSHKGPHNQSHNNLAGQLLQQQNTLQSKISYKSQISNDEEIVPALGMKKPIDFNTVGDDELPSSSNPVESVSASQEELKLSNIPTTQRPIADALVPLFGEEVACLVFARAWANREKGISMVIDKMEQILQKESEHPGSHGTLLQLINECLKDKVQQVGTKTFAMTESYISALQKHKNINPKQEASNFEKVLISLLDRLADPKYASKTEHCFFQLLNVEQIEGNFLIGFLLKPTSYVNKNNAVNFKHQIPRLTIMNQLISEFPKYENQLKKTSQQTFPFNQLIAKIKEGVDASNPEHRKISLQLIVTLYQQFGYKRVELLIGELALKHLEVLAKDIPEAEAYTKTRKQSSQSIPPKKD